jgi:peptide/nickel transport system permease protein
MSNTSQSFAAAAWKRLKKNKGAVFGLLIISIAILIALFAYFIAPDKTPNANRIIVEIDGERPGFKQQFLLVKKENLPNTSFIKQLLFGKEDQFIFIPISAYQEKKTVLLFKNLLMKELLKDNHFQKTIIGQSCSTNNVSFRYGGFGRDILSRLIVGTRVSLSVGLITVIISLTIGLILGSLAGYFRGRTDEIIMWFINIIWSIPTLLLVFAITLLLGKGFWQSLLQ